MCSKLIRRFKSKHNYRKKWTKKIAKHILWECKYGFDGKNCNSDECRCECKIHHVCKKDYFCNRAACNCQNGKYLATIKGDSVIKFFDEITDSYDETKKIQKTLMKKKQPAKRKVEIKKQKLHQYKRSISIKNIDLNKILGSNMISFGEKIF